jgi:hypothetical protein
MAEKRIYAVTDPAGSVRLVRASTKAQALDHCTRPYRVEIAAQETIVDLVSGGTKVEDTAQDETP